MGKNKFIVNAGYYKMNSKEFEFGFSLWKEYRGIIVSDYFFSIAFFKYIFSLKLTVKKA